LIKAFLPGVGFRRFARTVHESHSAPLKLGHGDVGTSQVDDAAGSLTLSRRGALQCELLAFNLDGGVTYLGYELLDQVATAPGAVAVR